MTNQSAHDPYGLLALREAGAALVDPVGWHYIEVLAERTRLQNGMAQTLLQARLDQALQAFSARMTAAPDTPAAAATSPSASPLALLLQEMKPAGPATSAVPGHPDQGWAAASPRVQQFRRQLRKISVQKQVSQAMAQAPQNAGPINSHMLVLRALGLMRDISPDYLNRFMNYVDTLLCLDESERQQLLPKKSSSPSRTSKKKPSLKRG